jgi:hypothetical protein
MKEDGNAPEQADGIVSKPPRSRELREMLSRFHRDPSNAKKHPMKISPVGV